MAGIEERLEAQENIAQNHEDKLRQAFEDAMLAVTQSAPTLEGVMIAADHEAQIRAILSDLWLEATEVMGREIIGEFKDLFDVETKQDEDVLFAQILQKYIESYGAAAVQQITETTRRQIRDIILTSQVQGASFDAIVSEIRERVPDIARLRAHVIARTEVHSASVFAGQGVARSSRRPLNKEWVSVADARTRDFGEGSGKVSQYNHRAMNGVQVALDMPYMVPTIWGTPEPLMFPGDKNGSAGNIINCRCQEIYVRVE